MPVDGGRPAKRRFSEITFFDFAAGLCLPQKYREDLPRPRAKPATVGHRRFSPDSQPDEFYYSKLMMHLVWKRPGDWLTEADNNSHAAALNRVARDKQNYSTFLESVCYPQFNGTVQAARELHAVHTEMLVKAKLSTVSGYVHSRAVEENYRDALSGMEALKERHGEDIDFIAPNHVPTSPTQNVFAKVESGKDAEKKKKPQQTRFGRSRFLGSSLLPRQEAVAMLIVEDPSPMVSKQLSCLMQKTKAIRSALAS